jgi:hypothetical protein
MPSRSIFPARSTMQIAVVLSETSSPTNCSIAIPPWLRGKVSSILGEPIPRACVWLGPELSQCVKTRRGIAAPGILSSAVIRSTKKTEKFAFRSALGPIQFSFSHSQDPLRTRCRKRWCSATVEMMSLSMGRGVTLVATMTMAETATGSPRRRWRAAFPGW